MHLQFADEVCLFFGTFNPIHYGHLAIAEFARTQFEFKKIMFIPAFHPPHRPQDSQIADFQHRHVMVKLACKDNPYFTVTDIESKRQGPSYTIETLKQIFPQLETRQVRIPLIIGEDALNTIASWHQSDLLIEKSLFLLAPRLPDLNSAQEYTVLPHLQTKLIEMPTIGISSSLIRQRLKTQKSIRYLTPQPVIDYIEFNQLYP